jgi:hypothetical protein
MVDGVTADNGDASGRRSGPKNTHVFYSCILVCYNNTIDTILFTLFIHGTSYSIQPMLYEYILPREAY